MKALKHFSDGMLLLAVVFLVVGIVGPVWAYWVAAFCLVDSFVLTWMRRRAQKTRRAARQT